MQQPWGVPAVFGDGDHQGHLARFWSFIQGWAWDEECRHWIEAEPEQEVA